MPTNSFGAASTLRAGNADYRIFRLGALEEQGIGNVGRLPFATKILLENLLRQEDGRRVTAADIEYVARGAAASAAAKEISFMPARVLLQDFTGVPCVVDLAAMRDALAAMGADPKRANPLLPADLVIDHSVQVDSYGGADSFGINALLEFQRNRERYILLRWGQTAFQNFRVVPPDTGIVHQVNLEYLASVVFRLQTVHGWEAYPDTLVGTDSHTTMVNGLGVLGWGVGGIEAEACMLGQPVSMLLPPVVGFKLHGRMHEGATATDLVLTITQILRKKGVVGKIVEFYGQGLSALSLADRATVGNMAPEYGATAGFFPVDAETLAYLRFTNRDASLIELVEAYTKEQGLFRTDDTRDPAYAETVDLDLATVTPSMAGPKRPQDRVDLPDVKKNFEAAFGGAHKPVSISMNGGAMKGNATLDNGSVVIAGITSCTNTSNPSVMLAAGLLAKKAVERGLKSKPWVKTSLAPGSKVVSDYYREAGLTPYLEALNFHLVGYGCTTCIGNSGPLPEPVAEAVQRENLTVAAVLSGNRNFEGRINALVKANYLASPPLVVAYALAGRIDIDLTTEPLGEDSAGAPVYLRDIWPSDEEVRCQLADYEGALGPHLCVGPQVHVHQASAVFRPHGGSRNVSSGPARHACAGAAGRFHHDRSYFARWFHRQRYSGGPLSDRAGRAAEGFQLLWRAARQPRSDGTRNAGQRAVAQPTRAGNRRRLDPAFAGWRADVHLRCVRHVPAGRRAAGNYSGQGIRLRIVAGLGGQRRAAAGGEGRNRRELRAYPSHESGRHGRASAAIYGWRKCSQPAAYRSRAVQRGGCEGSAERYGAPRTRARGGRCRRTEDL